MNHNPPLNLKSIRSSWTYEYHDPGKGKTSRDHRAARNCTWQQRKKRAKIYSVGRELGAPPCRAARVQDNLLEGIYGAVDVNPAFNERQVMDALPYWIVPGKWRFSVRNVCCGTSRFWFKRGAFDSAKIHKRQRRKRQSVTAKREKSQTPKFV